jgi:hypothetical protein
MYNAAPLKVDRASIDRPSKYVPRASVSIVGGIQPDVLRESLTPDRLADGLAGRFIFIFPPEPDAPAWTDATIAPETRDAVQAVFDFLYALDFDAKEPRCVHLSAEATTIFAAFTNDVKRERQAMGNVPLAGAWAKFEAIPARLAQILEMVHDAVRGYPPPPNETQFIPLATMESAIKITGWLMHESRRVYAMLGHVVDDPQGLSIEWIRSRGGVATPRQLRDHSRQYATSEAAGAALNKLVKAGAGRWETGKQNGAGRPSIRFVLNGTP